MQNGFPEITSSFLQGQDILYTQFNDVEFYVEDIDQENLYYVILKKLFGEIRFEKIFPLGGKQIVFQNARLNIGNKKKVYLVDLDFDEILGNIKNEVNIFYLDKYSIENYLLDCKAIYEIIKEERPKIKDAVIQTKFDSENFKKECMHLFRKLICYYLIIQKHNLLIENVKIGTARFCDFTTNPASLKNDQIYSYHKEIEEHLKLVNPYIKVEFEIKEFMCYFSTLTLALDNIPGKYILNFLKYRIEHLFSLSQFTLESFIYRLAKNSELEELFFLKQNILLYMK